MRRLVFAIAAGVAAFLAVLGFLPGQAVLALEILVLYLGAVLLVAVAARAGAGLPRAGRSPIQQALSRPRQPEPRVAELERLERVVTLGVSHAGDLHVRLRPLMREIAGPLLAARGVDLERDPAAARALLGEDAWELVRDDLPRPEDPFQRGIPEARLRAAVETLERMAG